MQMYQVGLFRDAENFVNNFVKMLEFNSEVIELMDWMRDVQAGLDDPTLPDDVKAQAIIDYNEIQKRFDAFSTSMASA